MPELPEVERARRLAVQVAQGRRIESVDCADDPIVYDRIAAAQVQRCLIGRTVIACHRHGKHLWFELDNGPHPLFHLGMSGGFHAPCNPSLSLQSGPSAEHFGWPPKYWKLRLYVGDSELVMTDARRLGRIRLRTAPLAQPPLCNLGFDPLLNMSAPQEFSERLRERRGNIKSLLLNQRFIAGVGNWMADEVLYQAGIDPHRSAADLTADEAGKIHRALGSIVQCAVNANADDSKYPEHWLFHRRWSRPRHTRTANGEAIAFTTIHSRTTAWIPSLQS